MPASEFYECYAAEQIEPFGERRRDLQAGIVVAGFYNAQRTKDSDRIFSPLEFVQHLWDDPKPKAPQTPEQQLAFMLALQQIQNGKVNGG